MSIPFEQIGAKQRASEEERDSATMALIGYVEGVLESDGIETLFREGVMKRVNAVRQAYGLKPLTFEIWSPRHDRSL